MQVPTRDNVWSLLVNMSDYIRHNTVPLSIFVHVKYICLINNSNTAAISWLAEYAVF